MTCQGFCPFDRGVRDGITDVALRLGIDADTLRYHGRRGVLPRPPRDAGGRRRYGEEDIHLIEVLIHLKSTGMPLTRIAEFTRLVALVPAGAPERLAILQQHRQSESWVTASTTPW